MKWVWLFANPPSAASFFFNWIWISNRTFYLGNSDNWNSVLVWADLLMWRGITSHKAGKIAKTASVPMRCMDLWILHCSESNECLAQRWLISAHMWIQSQFSLKWAWCQLCHNFWDIFGHIILSRDVPAQQLWKVPQMRSKCVCYIGLKSSLTKKVLY